MANNEPPNVERDRLGRIMPTGDLVGWYRDAWNAGTSLGTILRLLGQGVNKNQLVGIKSRSFGFNPRTSPIIRYDIPRQTTQAPYRLRRDGATENWHPDRQGCGSDPLPAFHSISWDAIRLDAR